LVKSNDGPYEIEQITLISGMMSSRWSLNEDTYCTRGPYIVLYQRKNSKSHFSLLFPSSL